MNILTTIAQNLQSSIAQTQVRKARANALRSALIAVTVRHPEYQGVGFDEALMNNQAATLIEPFLTDGTLPNADDLAAIWATQFQFSTTGTQKAIANITPTINDFVYILATTVLSDAAQFSPAVAQAPSTMPTGYATTLQMEPSS